VPGQFQCKEQETSPDGQGLEVHIFFETGASKEAKSAELTERRGRPRMQGEKETERKKKKPREGKKGVSLSPKVLDGTAKAHWKCAPLQTTPTAGRLITQNNLCIQHREGVMKAGWYRTSNNKSAESFEAVGRRGKR